MLALGVSQFCFWIKNSSTLVLCSPRRTTDSLWKKLWQRHRYWIFFIYQRSFIDFFFFFWRGFTQDWLCIVESLKGVFFEWDWNLCFGEYCLNLPRPNLHKVPWMRSTCCWKISLSFKGFENGIVLLTVVREWKTNDLLILTNPGGSLTMAELSALKNII